MNLRRLPSRGGRARLGGASNLKLWDIHRYDPLQWSFTGSDKLVGTADEPSVFSCRGSEENFIRALRTDSIWMAGIKGSF